MSKLFNSYRDYKYKITVNNIFLFLIFIYQYIILFSNFYNIRLGYVNLQIFSIYLSFIILAFLFINKITKSLGWKIILILSMGLLFVPLKILLGYLKINQVQGMRCFFSIPLFWSLYRVFVIKDDIKNKVLKIIIYNCFFIAIFGIIHFFFFPEILINRVDTAALNIYSIPGHYSESAFFGNPSYYSAILVVGLTAIYLSKCKNLLYSLMFIVIFFGIGISTSRLAIIFSIIFLVLFLKNLISGKHLLTVIVLLIIILVVSIFFESIYFLKAFEYGIGKLRIKTLISEKNIISWINEIMPKRVTKSEIGLKSLFFNTSNFFFGTSELKYLCKGDTSFSDNSFIFICLNYGMPLGILWIFIVLLKIVPIRLLKGKYIIIFSFFYANFLLTPSVYWDLWLLYVLGIINYIDTKSLNKR